MGTEEIRFACQPNASRRRPVRTTHKKIRGRAARKEPIACLTGPVYTVPLHIKVKELSFPLLVKLGSSFHETLDSNPICYQLFFSFQRSSGAPLYVAARFYLFVETLIESEKNNSLPAKQRNYIIPIAPKN